MTRPLPGQCLLPLLLCCFTQPLCLAPAQHCPPGKRAQPCLTYAFSPIRCRYPWTEALAGKSRGLPWQASSAGRAAASASTVTPASSSTGLAAPGRRGPQSQPHPCSHPSRGQRASPVSPDLFSEPHIRSRPQWAVTMRRTCPSCWPCGRAPLPPAAGSGLLPSEPEPSTSSSGACPVQPKGIGCLCRDYSI